MRSTLLSVIFVGVCGCAGATNDQLVKRAAFDFECPEDQIQITDIDDRTRGATGCGKRATFVEDCRTDTKGGKMDCTWVMNSTGK